MIVWLLVTHIAVLGYWLGSELVINSTYRLASYADDMPFAQRDRLMHHVMDVDQHVRYALVLQASLGAMLAASYGYIPGGSPVVLGAAVFGIAWLGFVEAAHRLRENSKMNDLDSTIVRRSQLLQVQPTGSDSTSLVYLFVQASGSPG